MKRLAAISAYFLLNQIEAQNTPKDEARTVHEEIGNLTLPTSQQPGPLFAFGQNIVDKGDLQLFGQVDYLRGRHVLFADVTPLGLYGITNNLSVFAYLPIATKFRICNQQSKGLEDAFLQLEYAFFNQDRPRYLRQATVVGALVVPSGSSKKCPPTGFGSPSVFLGVTASHNGVDWYLFGSPGVLVTTKHHGTKFGNWFFYYAGIGKNIMYVPKELIFMYMVEFLASTDNEIDSKTK